MVLLLVALASTQATKNATTEKVGTAEVTTLAEADAEVADLPAQEGTTEGHPHAVIPGKPSKFDENVDDKIYVDVVKLVDSLRSNSTGPVERVKIVLKKRRPLGRDAKADTDAGETKTRSKRSFNSWYPEQRYADQRTQVEQRWRRQRLQRRFIRFPGRPWYPARLPQPPLGYLNPQDTYGPRSPRLVFRDPVEPSTLQAPWNHNGLQDVSAPDTDARGECTEGSCQSVLTCWFSWGRVVSACSSGLLQVCCDHSTGKTSSGAGQTTEIPANYGPVVNDPRCGVSVKQGAQRRIVGGDEAGFGSFPWQAYIRIGSSRCGGSLVNRYHVVTAGHCVARASARQVQVTLGDYVINSAVEPLPAYTYGVRQISVHPYFKFTPQADRFDVAVLRLDRPVQYMPHIAPICLPTKGEDFLGQFGWAAGWGALQPGSRLRPKTLQSVDVPVIDNRLCERWHRSNGINVVIYEEMMCAGYRGGGKDSCQGDSGGPLMLERSGRWYLIGIVSAGYSCAQRGQPGIYHRVAHTVDWISHIINS
ncbi:hypothetical protein AAG570_010551 [Ranatra chinensis]|uniref:Peptidase S1 domain-containing protein n=1 Tax=Ranatra chinensis TaxID=642074 RepID=A0ABD0ZB73_9HEMI